MRRLLFSFLLIGLAACPFAAPGESAAASDSPAPPPPPSPSSLQRVLFHPDWFAGVQFAGLYVAMERGLYAQAGLAVELRPFAFGRNSARDIADEPDAAVLPVGSIEGYIFLQRRAQGHDLKALAAMFQDGPAGFMSLEKTGIRSIKDFAGKRVGVHAFAAPIYRWLLRHGGVAETDAPPISTQDDLGPLLRGELDLQQGFAIAEFVALTRATDGRARFISFAELGLPSYSQVFFTSSAATEKHGDALRRFLAASQAGWTWAFAHPDETVKLIAARHAPDLDPALARLSLEAMRLYVMPDGRPPLAPMRAERWLALQRALIEMGLLSGEQPEPVAAFLDQRFAPAAGSTPTAPATSPAAPP